MKHGGLIRNARFISGVTKETLNALPQITNIELLRICDFTFPRLDSLRNLKISQVALSTQQAQEIVSINTLRVLEMSACGIQYAHVKHFAGALRASKLETLSLFDNELGAAKDKTDGFRELLSVIAQVPLLRFPF